MGPKEDRKACPSRRRLVRRNDFIARFGDIRPRTRCLALLNNSLQSRRKAAAGQADLCMLRQRQRACLSPADIKKAAHPPLSIFSSRRTLRSRNGESKPPPGTPFTAFLVRQSAIPSVWEGKGRPRTSNGFSPSRSEYKTPANQRCGPGHSGQLREHCGVMDMETVHDTTKPNSRLHAFRLSESGPTTCRGRSRCLADLK